MNTDVASPLGGCVCGCGAHVELETRLRRRHLGRLHISLSEDDEDDDAIHGSRRVVRPSHMGDGVFLDSWCHFLQRTSA